MDVVQTPSKLISFIKTSEKERVPGGHALYAPQSLENHGLRVASYIIHTASSHILGIDRTQLTTFYRNTPWRFRSEYVWGRGNEREVDQVEMTACEVMSDLVTSVVDSSGKTESEKRIRTNRVPWAWYCGGLFVTGIGSTNW